ncbi:Oidioi.mRNA.OKI2018_I69.chr1.g325.t1.cds [Oikopleura dioica]|uniref:Oidioi.mRNA.OKI2018_I69.chr1.g325.t1.cds n=1 Tax=Oikopleura dioica TaxID=34765 RepID=A0ABN7SN75_OIKDI|nr:Oidioi.mRNA.OKI2018_I69.chr1.g325.t1.cds [Oikopleura dioica]
MLLTMIVYLDVLSSSVPIFEELGKAPRLLFLFLLTVIGSVFAHIMITVSLWCQEKKEDRIFEFSKTQAKFALCCARFNEKFIQGEYNIPHVILQKCNEDEKNDNEDDNLHRIRENQNADEYHDAWIFYAKMLSHFWALILTVTIITVTFGIIIDLHVQSSNALDEIYLS